MQTFQISTVPAPGPKNYVFVDEHNRHKRLKVMRACEGCRRRKIKCDAATTNTWPCGACRRLKLPCVPPAGGVDGEQVNDSSEIISTHGQDLTAQQFLPQQGTYRPHFQPNVSHGDNVPAMSNLYDIQQPQQMYTQQVYSYDQQDQQHLNPQASLKEYRFQSFDSAASQQSASSPRSPDQQTAEVLTEQLGDLKISETGVAAYIRQQETSSKELAGPIQENDYDPLPVPLSTAAGSQIRIPPALMPTDDDAMDSFDIFFEHVHPYAPVICKSQFYHQWTNDRESISPLLLEAVFACAARMSGEPVGDSAWLALANSKFLPSLQIIPLIQQEHEASFLDTPRLSTIQALILVLKAREGSPKRGYFYKSWMTCKTIVSMAKDLDLHEHFATHTAGESCGSLTTECLAKTRVWQTLLVCEMMIGGPQGRSDLGVDPETVDYSTKPPHSAMDDFEAMTSRRYAFFIRNARNIRLCLGAYLKVRKRKEWALDPEYVVHNDKFKNWPNELPKDLQIVMPTDNSRPSITSHFIGNMHCHHQLGIIMMHRPQLLAVKSYADDQQWRHHLMICYNAAKKMCQLQEAIVAQHDVLGLLCMQRGMSFTIYAILTCTMLHMIAITSPDPEFNTDAKEYFVRHMQLLEKCVPEWPMIETEQQINNLRVAFSADLNKPFVLKASFPYGSPDENSPTLRRSSEQPSSYGGSTDQGGYVQQHWQQDGSHFPTPPMSIGTEATSPHTTSMYQDYSISHPQPQYRQMAPTSYPTNEMAQTQPWNPAPIIDQFNTAFAIPPSALAPPPTSSYGTPPPVMMSQTQQYTPSPQTPNYDHNMYSQHHAHLASSQPTPQIPQQHQNQYQQNQPQYFDLNMHNNQSHMPPNMTQSTYSQEGNSNMSNHQHNNGNIRPQPHNPGMVYVTPKQWQQSVASVYDPSGLKRKWQFDAQGGVPHS